MKKVIIKAKNKKDFWKAFLVQKYADKLFKDNPDFLPDIEKLAREMIMFKAKWGIDIRDFPPLKD